MLRARVNKSQNLVDVIYGSFLKVMEGLFRQLTPCWQDEFHMGTHWLQAGGVFRKILDPFMNSLPDEPLPKFVFQFIPKID